MNKSHLRALGIPNGPALDIAYKTMVRLFAAGAEVDSVKGHIAAVVASPETYADHADFSKLAQAMKLPVGFTPRDEQAPWKSWCVDAEPGALQQMHNSMNLPVAVGGALMPDAHQGYGLPIGGVLATDNCVVPYAVGVDIACRMKLTVLDLPVSMLEDKDGMDRLKSALTRETYFGMGATAAVPYEHAVMDADWGVSPVTRRMKERARKQLGTSGSGNHFVEFGELHISDPDAGLPPGTYLALLSHSGSRGTGAQVCDHYSKLAKAMHPGLPDAMQHLGWLPLDHDAGREYWGAMELMGRYAAANHDCIHRAIAKNLKASVLLDVENHHNFAWKERHFGREVVVHRKGATPAGAGVLGIIPGSMATPGYLVRGKGSVESLHSASHGAGRVMSRTKAEKTLNWEDSRRFLAERRVHLISAGLDEVPFVYKDIHAVMAAQADLVDTLARFDPRLVKMCHPGERAED